VNYPLSRLCACSNRYAPAQIELISTFEDTLKARYYPLHSMIVPIRPQRKFHLGQLKKLKAGYQFTPALKPQINQTSCIN
jgi:hypothetical protein